MKYLYTETEKMNILPKKMATANIIAIRNITTVLSKKPSENYICENVYNDFMQFKNRENQFSEMEFECTVLTFVYRKYFVEHQLLHIIADFKHFNTKLFFQILVNFSTCQLSEQSFNNNGDVFHEGVLKFISMESIVQKNYISFKELNNYSTTLNRTNASTKSTISTLANYIIEEEKVLKEVSKYTRELKNSIILMLTQKSVTKQTFKEILNYE
jgi:hypothetical protein